MADESGSVQRWLLSPQLSWVRLFAGLLLVLAGIWLVIAGPLFDRRSLDIVGAILLGLGIYLSSIGVRALHHAGH